MRQQILTKQGVTLTPLKGEMYAGLLATRNVFERHGETLVVTSTTDGQHKKGSLHYIGLAADIRTRALCSLSPRELHGELVEHLARLDERFQVVLETTHIHIEYDRRLNHG